MNNKKGFTLTELIGVIFVLGIILLLVSIPTIKNLQKGTGIVFESQLKIIEISTENWISNNTEDLPKNEGESVTITVGTLKQEGEVETDLVDPTTGKCIPNDTKVVITLKNGKYEIKVDPITGKNECPEIDDSVPIIYLNGEAIDYVEFGSPWVDPGAIAKTSKGVPITDIKVEVTKNGPTVDTNRFGEYEITYTAEDNGEIATVIRTVIIVDTTPPTINVPDDITIDSTVTNIDLLDGVTATDIADGDITDKIKVTGSVTPGILGEYVITYEVEDESGNKTTVTRKIRIVDKTKPWVEATVVGEPFNSNGWADGNFDVKIRVYDEGGSGPKNFYYCQTTSSTCDPLSGTFVDEVVRNITVKEESWTNRICVIAVDNAGNNGEKQCFGPYKLDKTKPELSFSSTLTGYQSQENYPAHSDETYSDNLTANGDLTWRITDNIDWSETGWFTVTYYLTDLAGNTRTVTRSIYIIDDVPPSFYTSKSCSKPGDHGWCRGNITVYMHGSDNSTGIDHYEYKRSGSWSNLGGSSDYFSSEGSRRYYYRAQDGAGNYSSSDYEWIDIDKTPPDVTNTTSSVTLVQLDSAGDIWSGISYSDNISSNSEITTSTSGNVNTSVAGTYNITYTIKDYAGNESYAYRTYTVLPLEYTVDVNTILNGSESGTGHSGITFDVYRSDTDSWSYGVTDWYEVINYGTRIIVKGNNINGYTYNGGDFDNTITSDTVIKPSYTRNTYTISFDTAGGDYIAPYTYTVIDSISLPTPYRRGYAFLGWTGTGLSGASTSVTIPAGSTGNRSYTATWRHYDANDYGGVFIRVHRDGISWDGTCTGTYPVGTNDHKSGNWKVTVTANSVTLKGTKTLDATPRYYQMWAYQANDTSDNGYLGSDDGHYVQGQKAELSVAWP